MKKVDPELAMRAMAQIATNPALKPFLDWLDNWRDRTLELAYETVDPATLNRYVGEAKIISLLRDTIGQAPDALAHPAKGDSGADSGPGIVAV